MFSPSSSKSNRRSTRVGRGTTSSSRRNAWSRSNSRGSGGSSLGLRQGKARKWAQVKRPPAPGVGFVIPTWVPVSQLTEEERQAVVKKKRVSNNGTVNGTVEEASVAVASTDASTAQPLEQPPPTGGAGPSMSGTSGQGTVSFSLDESKPVTGEGVSDPAAVAPPAETGTLLSRNDRMDVDPLSSTAQPQPSSEVNAENTGAPKESSISVTMVLVAAKTPQEMETAETMLGASTEKPVPSEASKEKTDEIIRERIEATEMETSTTSAVSMTDQLEVNDPAGTEAVVQTTIEFEKGGAFPQAGDESKMDPPHSLQLDNNLVSGPRRTTDTSERPEEVSELVDGPENVVVAEKSTAEAHPPSSQGLETKQQNELEKVPTEIPPPGVDPIPQTEETKSNKSREQSTIAEVSASKVAPAITAALTDTDDPLIPVVASEKMHPSELNSVATPLETEEAQTTPPATSEADPTVDASLANATEPHASPADILSRAQADAVAPDGQGVSQPQTSYPHADDACADADPGLASDIDQVTPVVQQEEAASGETSQAEGEEGRGIVRKEPMGNMDIESDAKRAGVEE